MWHRWALALPVVAAKVLAQRRSWRRWLACRMLAVLAASFPDQ
jgi:hypothetical protein